MGIATKPSRACPQCGDPIGPRAKYCSPACKQRAYRGRVTAESVTAESPAAPDVTTDLVKDTALDDALLMDEDAREYFEERAAIAEYDGELSRGEAEQLASSRVYEYRLAGINQWLTLIGSDDGGLETAKRWCAERYGDRVEAVRRYRPSSLSGRADK